MELQFELSQQAYVEGNLAAWKRLNGSSKLIGFLGIVGALAFLGLGIVAVSNQQLFWAMFAFGWMAMILVYLFVLRSRIVEASVKGNFAKSSTGVTGLITAILTEQELIWKNAISESRIPWNAVKNLIETEDYLVVVDNSTNSAIFPRQALNSDETSKAVREYVRNHSPQVK